jgi:uncharacterized protein
MNDPVFIHPPDPGIPPPLPPHAASGGNAGSTAAPSFNPSGRLVDPTVTHEQRTYALLMHASIVLLHFMLFFSFLVPLVMWLAKRDQSRFIDDHGRETVNFHLTITLYAVVSMPLMMLCGVGIGVLVATYILAIVGGIMACLAASRAEYFRYPMCIRFIR